MVAWGLWGWHYRHTIPAGRGPVGKEIVADVKDRATGKVGARVVESTDSATLQGFVRHHAAPGTTVCTDEAGGYQDLTDMDHHTVNHGVGEYVNDMARTNGIESLLEAGMTGKPLLDLVTGIRRNMKNDLMPLPDKVLLRKRFIIEILFDTLKSSLDLEHSRHRSPINAFVDFI